MHGMQCFLVKIHYFFEMFSPILLTVELFFQLYGTIFYR